MRLPALILAYGFIAYWSTNSVFGQCSGSPNAGDDITVCPPGDVVQLSGFYTGGGDVTYTWSPAFGLSDPNSPNPQVFVNSTTTYTLSTTVVNPNDNLLANPGFESGLADFTSDYVPGTGGIFGLLSNEGEFAVAGNSNQTHSNFADCPAFSGSQMLVVNGATQPGENVWCQTVSVLPNVNYQLSAWLTSVENTNPAVLQFFINGQQIANPFSLTSAVCNWQQFFGSWNSGGNTSAEICIANQNTQNGGNDFALDELAFAPVCEQSDQVTVSVVPMDLFVIDPGQLSCTDDATVTLDGSFSISGPGYSFQWSTINGNIVSGANTPIAIADQPGTYTLLLVYTDGTTVCTNQSSIVVTADQNIPTAQTLEPDRLTCTDTLIQLDGSGSSTGGGISYEWTTTDGQIISGENTLEPIVGAAGTYTLEVTNTSNGCFRESTVLVQADTLPPNAEAGATVTIDCNAGSQQLSGIGSSTAGNFTYNWTTADGNIESGQNTLTPTVNAQGLYQIEVTDQDNGCTAFDTVSVVEQGDLPAVEIQVPDQLDCNTSQVQLDATASDQGTGFTISWETADGTFQGGTNGLEPTVNAAGTYQLTILDQGNGCESMAQVTVTIDTLAPNAITSPDDTLTCADTELMLDGSASSSGADFTYQWSSVDGQFTSPTGQANTSIDAPGTYQLVVVDTTNGCASTNTVVIGIDTLSPIADAGFDQILNCQDSSFILGGASSSTGSDFSFLWTSAGGSLDSPADGETVLVSTPGSYQLQVTNTENGCRTTDQVSVQIDRDIPDVDAGSDFTIICTDSAFTTQATGSTESTFSYNWSTPDGNLTGPDDMLQTSLDQPGTYIIEVVDNSNFCLAIDSILVDTDTLAPVVEAGPTDTLTCSDTSLQLDGSASSSGANFIYEWSSIDGQFVGPTDQDTANIDASGTYRLQITNTDNGCTAFDLVEIAQDTLGPTADAGLDQVLNCQDSSFVLGGSGTSQGNDFILNWTSAGGNIDGPTDGPSVLITVPGTYQLAVNDLVNGCIAVDEVEVTIDRELPQVDAGAGFTLTCSETSFNPSATADSGSGISYVWSTTDGNFSGPTDQLMTEVDQPGTYMLTALNSDNFCQSEDQVIIGQDTASPIIVIEAADELDCENTFEQIDASGSSSGAAFIYAWSTSDGNVVSGSDTSMPTVDEAGTYTLLLTNTDNGCTSTNSIDVVQDVFPPTATVLPAEVLNCNITEIELNALGSSQGVDFEVEWTTTDGTFTGGTDGLQPTVSAPGTYSLLVRNVLNSCTSTFELIVEQDITPPLVDAGEDVAQNCESTPTTLPATALGTGPFTYIWSTDQGQIISGADGPSPIVEGVGTYTLQVIDEHNGCSAIDRLSLSQNLLTDFELTLTEATCAVPAGRIDFSDVIGDSPPYIYSIDDGESFQTSPAFGNLEAGSYTAIVQDVNGCELSEAVVVNPPDELGLFLIDQVEIQLGDSIRLVPQFTVDTSEIDQLSWSPAVDLSCSNCPYPFVNTIESRTYRLDVLDLDGCSAEATILVLVDRTRPVYFPTAFSPNEDGDNDRFFPYARTDAVVEVKSFLIADRWGETVFSASNFRPNDPAFGWDGFHQGQLLNPAVFVYLAEIEFVDGTVEVFKGDVTLVR
ncbi:MAG: gliding motility-associated C-terminal domain-containing protein [Bacteroidota bacterium]